MRTVRQCVERDGVGIVPLSRGLEAVVDLVDLPLVEPFNWAALCTKTGHAYAQRSRTIEGRVTHILMHRAIIEPPPGMVIDHINGNGLDNRRSNLRICSHNDNMKNQVVHRINKLQAKGVYLPKGKQRYRATITFNGRKIRLGSYATVQEAAAAYKGAAIALGGEFANDT
ncbi:HNH endonuclease [Brevundimonas nasdae]|uniref:HNH endonuclease n=1 Tax=Brevundimonas nasdae TaxID=172043 RepID=A0ABX8THT3_9CAUL|nr:HNH endonuclease [Brevundimonas nasdae]QYC10549.1 HNH endonuclease [Brevundimonas nasdae]QYC13336.1 HNH endonuclease [Brevundimonas nasdae]